ncbi:50S ribosomal protein L10 [Candidatus Bathyarchaeota archaeon RBG_16_57_9]|nr:MAG: 50S ribosomal protein L10 [Candidatus Bathyarchaeota archaeon RBG_16_57_9]OGD53769.1 MAG: 50S ribosomal protein L10 [Candidatus Bathyarchaeota archaeon RBG_13_60_20]
MSSHIPQEKTETVQEAVELLKEYEVIAAADLNKVNSLMLQDMRRQLRGRLEFKVLKNTLMRISMEEAGKKDIGGFIERIAGPNVFLFTNGNPFRVAMELDSNKVKVFAKPGDVALSDITISAGNSGLSPGPLIGKFGSLGVRTRIEAGSIWVAQDTVVAKKGQVINEDLADLLQRLGVRAAEMGLRVKAVYERGEVIPGDALILDLAMYRHSLEAAVANAYKVAVEAAYVTPQTAPTLLAKAYQQARAVALEAEWPTRDTVGLLVAKANAQARSLASRVGKKMAQG